MTILTRIKQFGGIRLAYEYMRIGVMTTIINGVIKSLVKGQSLNRVYADIGNKINPMLLKRYDTLMRKQMTVYIEKKISHRTSNKIWFCWLQGMQDAPQTVKACLTSIKEHMPEKDIIIITEKNYSEYITLPEHIITKRAKNIIPPALFTDLIRLQLLITHGGVWMDATVLCTGWGKNNIHRKHAEEAMNSELFFFRYVNRRDNSFIGIGNWFIAAQTNNKALTVLRDMLYEYWKDYNCVMNYYIFHLFFSHIANTYPLIIRNMPKGYCTPCLQLGNRLTEEYNEVWWNKLTEHVCFHKLNYRKEKEALKKNYSYCKHIITKYNLNKAKKID